ncbi:MAG: NFACT RNA binding domain-containing protein [Deferribacteraceae bacterium]|jgi:predicted ribosome quality control (RQC) complex YloA/Tae2 family protein|nr:NFACT RNA binding domain-containing protein [Deferribacteraceae bacterium]
MDGLTFHKILRLIRQRWLGAALNRVSVLDGRLYFSFYKGSYFVITFKSSPPPSLEMTQTALGEADGALEVLKNSELTGVSSRIYDRIGRFDFEKRRPSGKLLKYSFILEPMGNYANAFLLNEQESILYSVSSGNIDPDRNIGVGKKYSEPRANKKYNLINTGGTQKFMDLTGFYPATAALAEEYQKIMGFAETVAFISKTLETDDLFYMNKDGRIAPFPPVGGANAAPFEKISFQNSGGKNFDRVLSARISKFYIKQLQRYERLYSKISADFDAAGNWSAIRDEAELVKVNLHIIKKREGYRLQKYTETGVEEVEYTYNSEEPPQIYADKLFRKSNKMKRSLPVLEERLKEVNQLVESAREQIYFTENAETEDLKELSELIKKTPEKTKKHNTFQSFIKYSSGDAVFYLGKNSAENYKLVFRFANPGDIWLHAQSIPSAHCIIRKEGAPSDNDILLAARLVASYSKNKHEPKVAVDYTCKKYVKKPKNTPVGFVVYTNFKTLTVLPLSNNEISTALERVV